MFMVSNYALVGKSELLNSGMKYHKDTLLVCVDFNLLAISSPPFVISIKCHQMISFCLFFIFLIFYFYFYFLAYQFLVLYTG